MIDWSYAVSRVCSDGVVVVCNEDPSVDADFVMPGGATRSDSVRAGMNVVPEDAQIVVVHDAARPMATPELFAAVIDAVRNGADAAIPGLPVADTIKRIGGALPAKVVETVDRSKLVAVQTPQAFSAPALRRAHLGEPQASDDAGLIEAQGGEVVVVMGETANVKITVREDLELMRMRVGGK